MKLLEKYFAVESWKRQNKTCNYEKQLEEIEDFFSDYTKTPGFIIIPRYNREYLSIRYCGLEVLQLTKRGKYRQTLEQTNKKIKRKKSNMVIGSLDEIKILMTNIYKFLNEKLEQEFTSINRKDDLIPGFSLEHWMESLFIANNRIGKETRESIGLNNVSLKNITSQAPIIKNPLPDKNRRRVDHIDLLAIDNDNEVIIIELKKDNDIETAMKEIKKYSEWVNGTLSEADDERGNINAMIKEGFIPPCKGNIVIKKKIVIVGECKRDDDGINIYNLPKNWLQNAINNKSLFYKGTF